MVHTMKLYDKYFDLVKNKEKVIEIRLNDEKRKLLSIGDTIIFLKYPNLLESISVIVDELTHYSSFNELISNNNANDLGISDSKKNIFLNELLHIYSPQKEKKYGVLSIKFHIIN